METWTLTTGSRWLLSALLIVGAALFAIGVAAEHSANDHHAAGVTTHVEGPSEGAEAAASDEGSAEHASEKVLGVDIESGVLVAVAVALSLALAFLTWRTNGRLVLLTTIAFAALFALLDIAEFVHQIKESRAGIAVLAAIIALVHAWATVAARRRLATSIG